MSSGVIEAYINKPAYYTLAERGTAKVGVAVSLKCDRIAVEYHSVAFLSVPPLCGTNYLCISAVVHTDHVMGP